MSDIDRFVENFDLRDPGVSTTPDVVYEIYERMREHRGSIVYSDRPEISASTIQSADDRGHWITVGYEETLKVAQDWRNFSSDRRQFVSEDVDPRAHRLDPSIITTDPPIQKALKLIQNPFFSRKEILKLEPAVRGHTNDLIDEFIEAGEADLGLDLAWIMPGLVFFTHLVKLPVEGVKICLALMDTWMHDTDLNVAVDAHRELREYLLEQTMARKNSPPKGDVIDALFEAELDGKPMSVEEVDDQIHLLVVAGLETTSNAIANSFYYLAQHPEERARLLAEPALLDTAVEEFLRFHGSLHGMPRRAAGNVDLCGHQFERGDAIALNFAAANRDPAEFPDAEKCVLDRTPNRHLAFGAGVHKCLGSNLARLELKVALDEVLRRLPDYEISNEAELSFAGAISRGYVKLPVRFTPGPREGRDPTAS